MTAGWWDAPLTLQDLAEAISVFNTLSFLSKYLFTTIRADFMDPFYLFICLSFIIPPQWVNSFIDTTIQPKYMVLFLLFWFLLWTTIWLKITFLITNLFQFQLHAHDILIKTYDPFSFVFLFLGSSTISSFHFHTTVWPKYMVLYHLFVHDHSTKIYGPLSFNLSFVLDHFTKN